MSEWTKTTSGFPENNQPVVILCAPDFQAHGDYEAVYQEEKRGFLMGGGTYVPAHYVDKWKAKQ